MEYKAEEDGFAELLEDKMSLKLRAFNIVFCMPVRVVFAENSPTYSAIVVPFYGLQMTLTTLVEVTEGGGVTQEFCLFVAETYP